MDPLSRLTTATIVLFVASVALPRAFPRWPPWAQAISRLTIFVLLTILLVQAIDSPFQPKFHGVDGAIFWERIVEAFWWILAARSAAGLARLLIVLEHRPRETQIISDLIAGAIYVAASLAIIDFALEVPVGGLLATSGIIAIVLGLALQSTLSDVFSGIAVGIERPYRAGDLLWVEGGVEGQVLQVNWRSTHISTVNGDVAIVPNSVIAKARLVNHSLPTPHRSSSIEIGLDAGVPPNLCMKTLKAAVQACLVPLSAPSIVRTALQGDGAVYQINFSVASGEKLGDARNELFAEIQRHLWFAGIPLAVAGQAAVSRRAIPTSADLLEQSDLFGILVSDERKLLADHLSEVWLEAGEILIREHESPRALFIVASGTVEITAAGSKAVHRMGPGGSIGAIGLITDAPYAATATALTPVKAYSLSRDAIAAAIAARPNLASGLEALARRGQAAMRSDVIAHEGDRDLEPSEMFLGKMRSFLMKLAVGTAR